MSSKRIIEGAMEALNIAETIKKFSDEDLLRELIRRNGIVEAPTSRTQHEYEVLLGIGKHHHCYITFHKEDVEALTGKKDHATIAAIRAAFGDTAPEGGE